LPKYKQVSVRLTELDYLFLKEISKKLGMPFATFLKSSAIERAKHFQAEVREYA